MLSLQKTNHKISHLFGYIFTGLFFTFCVFGGINAANATCTTGQLDINGDGTECVNGKFAIKTTNLNAGDTFKFSLSAAGAFTVDCGVDGALSGNTVPGGVILRNDTTNTVYTCTYSTGGAKTIVFDGTATNYNTDTSTAAISFDQETNNSAVKIASVSGSLSAMFPYISGNAANGAQPRFVRTFRGATNLTTVSDTLFADYTKSSSAMFSHTFQSCKGLTSIPARLFSGITTGAIFMFQNTFDSCTSLTSIPAELFNGITTGAGSMFYFTFYNCSSLTSIPGGLFSGITTGASGMFRSTFNRCSGLTSIPVDLFSGITTGAEDMFYGTFQACNNLSGYIPSSTFAGLISNASPTAEDMWYNTFVNTQLATTCPSGTTQYITGYEGTGSTTWNGKVSCVPDADVDSTVTYSCGDGTGTPPADQGAISGKPFVLPTNTCTKSGYNFAGWAVSGTNDVINDRFTWNYSGNKTLTAQWMTGKFEVTTTNLNDNDTFKFSLSAAGTFTVNCGENGTLESEANDISGNTITRNDTTNTIYTCTYSTGGVKTIGFDGTATNYSTLKSAAAISFDQETNKSAAKISAIYGNLSEIFPYISGNAADGVQPRFVYTFRGATNLTTVPETLFANYTKASSYMFQGTFWNCEGLTSIPAGLFSGITTGATCTFMYTFYGCSGLISIPENLFFPNATSVTGQSGMFYNTFYSCKGLTSIPAGLFSKITTGAQDLFYYTFQSCDNLTSIPEGLFANITTKANRLFGGTFSSCSRLSGHIPASTFAGLIANGSPTMENMWYNTFPSGVATTCPSGTTQYITGYEGNTNGDTWNGKVSCVPDAEADIVTYSCGDGTGTPPADQGAISGKPFVLPTNTCTKSGYNFAGWAVSGTNDVINDRFTWNYSGNKTLTAQWTSGKFEVTTTNLGDNDTFKFSLSAAGTFTVDCGENGTLESEANDVTNGNTITRNNVDQATYTCTYTTGGVKTIAFDGTATNYSTDTSTAAIAFSLLSNNVETLTPTKIALVAGNLSAIFPYTASGQQPRFVHTFRGASNLTTVPGTLFANYTKGTERMFYNTFNSSGLINIPAGLFSKITTGASYMFYSTFNGCTGLTSIPAGLFSSITTSALYLFAYTFSRCTGLTSIPENLFFPNATSVSGLTSMFQSTFYGCTGLTSIPAGLFSKVTSGNADVGMFSSTFANCTGLTSIPSGLFNNITVGFNSEFSATFNNCTGLTSIPAGLFSNITTGHLWCFSYTFKGCTGLTSIPADLFSGITSIGSVGDGLFFQTFYGCSNLAGYIPPSTFAGLVANNSPTATDMWNGTFNGTKLVTSCPAGTMPYITGYEGNTNGDTWNGKVSCQEIVPVMCDAGKYLEADDVMCYDCTSNNYCPGGIYTYDGSDLGLTQCPNNWYSPAGAASTEQCGRILHIGDNIVYLRSGQKTTPSLHVRVGNDTFYGNMTTSDVVMNSGTERKLKMQYNDTTYSIYDDSVELPTE